MLEDRLQRTPITKDDWSLGSPGAPVTLLEYGDFECPHCAAARPVVEGLVAEDPKTIRLVYRHFPVTTVHPHALIAAEAAEAAGAQGLFWEMHDMVFAHQPELSYGTLRTCAAAIGLDMARFDLEMETHTHLPEVRLDFRRGVQDGVNGTPTIFINRLRYDGPRERVSMQAAIAHALKAAPRKARGAA
jgi:protein-disulfide isomerase